MQIRKILAYYWPHVKKYKGGLIISWLAFLVLTIIGSIIVPIAYKKVFDLIATGDPVLVQVEIMHMVLVVFVLIIITNIAHIIAEYTYPAHQSKVLKSLNDHAFRGVQKHSESFFSNNFTGGLVSKINRFHNSFERIQDIITFQVFMNGIILISTFFVLMWYSQVLAMLFIGWLTLFVIGTLFFLKPMSRRDIRNSEEKSKTTAVMADIITNTNTMRMFANLNKEYRTF